MKRFVEDFPSIDIGLLKRRGLFEQSDSAPVVVQTKVGPWTFTSSEGSVVSATYEVKGKPITQSIELQVAQIRYGVRPYFVCPTTFERAAKLYLADGFLASRKAHGLVHLVTTNRKIDVQRGRTTHVATRLKGSALGKGPARGMRRSKLIIDLIQLDGVRWVDPEAMKIMAKVIRKEQDARYIEDRLRRIQSSSTAVALERGLASAVGWTQDEVLRQLADPLALAAAGRLPPMPELKLHPEHLHPRVTLDVRSLASAGLLEPEELKGAAMLWDRDYSGVVNYTLLAAEFTDWRAPYLLVENVDTFLRERYTQVIPIDYVSDRWYFKCPFTGARRTTLYLREGWWGSEKALNLRRDEGHVERNGSPLVDPDDYDLRSDDDPDEEDDEG